jgi:hypothetical protein
MEEEREGEKNKWLAFNSKVRGHQEFIVQLTADCYGNLKCNKKYLAF